MPPQVLGKTFGKKRTLSKRVVRVKEKAKARVKGVKVRGMDIKTITLPHLRSPIRVKDRSINMPVIIRVTVHQDPNMMNRKRRPRVGNGFPRPSPNSAGFRIIVSFRTIRKFLRPPVDHTVLDSLAIQFRSIHQKRLAPLILLPYRKIDQRITDSVLNRFLVSVTPPPLTPSSRMRVTIFPPTYPRLPPRPPLKVSTALGPTLLIWTIYPPLPPH